MAFQPQPFLRPPPDFDVLPPPRFKTIRSDSPTGVEDFPNELKLDETTMISD